MKIVLASNNAGKIREFSALLSPLNLEVIPQQVLGVADAPETGLTFVENALIKARNACLSTGLPAIADDSGLEVSALHGAPGIYSARYAGTRGDTAANIRKLLADMQEIPDRKRTANFYCVLVYMAHATDPTPLICQGSWEGTILREPRGEKGFGYDPIFFDPIQNAGAAELPADIKNQISHRGKALQLLLRSLPDKIKE